MGVCSNWLESLGAIESQFALSWSYSQHVTSCTASCVSLIYVHLVYPTSLMFYGTYHNIDNLCNMTMPDIRIAVHCIWIKSTIEVMKYNKSRVQYSWSVNRNKLPVEKWTLIGTVEKDLREGLDLEGTLIWREGLDLEGAWLGGTLILTVEKERREGCSRFPCFVTLIFVIPKDESKSQLSRAIYQEGLRLELSAYSFILICFISFVLEQDIFTSLIPPIFLSCNQHKLRKQDHIIFTWQTPFSENKNGSKTPFLLQ